ncbi:unnamed protein product, partial [Staurois parvus]
MGPVSSPQTQTTPKKAYEGYQGHLMGPPTDPGPLGQCPSFQMVSPPLSTTVVLHGRPCLFMLLSSPVCSSFLRMYQTVDLATPNIDAISLMIPYNGLFHLHPT